MSPSRRTRPPGAARFSVASSWLGSRDPAPLMSVRSSSLPRSRKNPALLPATIVSTTNPTSAAVSPSARARSRSGRTCSSGLPSSSEELTKFTKGSRWRPCCTSPEMRWISSRLSPRTSTSTLTPPMNPLRPPGNSGTWATKTPIAPGTPNVRRRNSASPACICRTDAYSRLKIAPTNGSSPRTTAKKSWICGMSRTRASMSRTIRVLSSRLRPGGVLTIPKMKLRLPWGR